MRRGLFNVTVQISAMLTIVDSEQTSVSLFSAVGVRKDKVPAGTVYTHRTENGAQMRTNPTQVGRASNAINAQDSPLILHSSKLTVRVLPINGVAWSDGLFLKIG